MASRPSVERDSAMIIKKLSETTSHDHDADDEEGIDRISELPEDIIHHIMEFLPRDDKDTTRLSVLSKKFFSFWCSFPAIDFNFVPNEPTLIYRSTESVIQCVRYRLHHRRLNNNTSLKRLTFFAPLHGGWEPEPEPVGNTVVVDLINFAIQNQVKELLLFPVYYNIPSHLRYWKKQFIRLSCLPEPVFSAKSITDLSLFGFSFDTTSSDHQHVIFNNSSIEVLSLQCCSGITSIMLRGAKRLKQVHLQFCYGLGKVHIEGPTTLEILTYSGEHYCEIDIASSCKRVKVLQLTDTYISDDKWVLKYNFFGIVEELWFANCVLPVKTRWYLESLKVLTLFGSENRVEFETPNLECFNFHSGSRREIQIPLVISSKRFEAKLDCFYHGLSSTYFRLNRFSKSICCFTNCQTLTLGCHSTEELIFSRAIRAKILHPPLHGIKHLKIELSKLHDMVELIDSLLWYAPHPNTISIINVHHPRAVKTIKFNYNEYVFCGYMCNGKCCWQRYLKEVALKKFEDVEERTRLQAYFFTTYKISPGSEHA